MLKQQWEPTIWDGTNDPEVLARFEAYSIKCFTGKIWLLAYNEPYFLGCKYHIVSSMSHNSDNSFSSLLTPEYNGLTLADAQNMAYEKIVKAIRA